MPVHTIVPVNCFRLGSNLRISLQGPRHLVFHPRLRAAYIINELKNTVTAFKYNEKDLSGEKVNSSQRRTVGRTVIHGFMFKKFLMRNVTVGIYCILHASKY